MSDTSVTCVKRYRNPTIHSVGVFQSRLTPVVDLDATRLGPTIWRSTVMKHFPPRYVIYYYYTHDHDKENLILELRKTDRRMYSKFFSRLDKCRRHKERLFKQNALWLAAQEELVSWRAETPSMSVPSTSKPSIFSLVGRPIV